MSKIAMLERRVDQYNEKIYPEITDLRAELERRAAMETGASESMRRGTEVHRTVESWIEEGEENKTLRDSVDTYGELELD